MEINKVQIKYFKKSGFSSDSVENTKHIKVLPYLSIVQSVVGSYDISLGHEPLQPTEDGGFFIAPSGVQQTIIHHVNRQSGIMDCRWIFLDVEINNTYKLDSICKFPVVINKEEKENLNSIFDRIFSTDDIWENYSDCYRLIGCILKNSEPIKKEPHTRIQKAVEYIKENYTENITIELLSSISNMSESNFYATFRRELGNSPISYLNHYRLSIAADKLIETRMTVNEICYSVGINDAFYFSKLFKRAYGLTPTEYRKTYQKK